MGGSVAEHHGKCADVWWFWTQVKQSKPGFSDENAKWLKPKFTEHTFDVSEDDEESEEEALVVAAKQKKKAAAAGQ